MKEFKTGVILELNEMTTSEMSAARVGSGALDVYSTPSMIAFMERTSMLCVAPALDESDTTVGGAVNIKHYKPTTIGKVVKCKSKLVAVKGKKIDFEVEVYENDQLIGDGSHTRFVVNSELFMKNL